MSLVWDVAVRFIFVRHLTPASSGQDGSVLGRTQASEAGYQAISFSALSGHFLQEIAAASLAIIGNKGLHSLKEFLQRADRPLPHAWANRERTRQEKPK